MRRRVAKAQSVDSYQPSEPMTLDPTPSWPASYEGSSVKALFHLMRLVIGLIDDGDDCPNGTQTPRLLAGTVSGPLPLRGARSAGLDTVPASKRTVTRRLVTVVQHSAVSSWSRPFRRGIEATKTHIRSPRPGFSPMAAAP